FDDDCGREGDGMRRRGPEVAILVLVALVLLASGCAGLPGEARTAASDGELPPPVRQVLPNGLRLIVQDHRASDIVALYLWVGVACATTSPMSWATRTSWSTCSSRAP